MILLISTTYIKSSKSTYFGRVIDQASVIESTKSVSASTLTYTHPYNSTVTSWRNSLYYYQYPCRDIYHFDNSATTFKILQHCARCYSFFGTHVYKPSKGDYKPHHVYFLLVTDVPNWPARQLAWYKQGTVPPTNSAALWTRWSAFLHNRPPLDYRQAASPFLDMPPLSGKYRAQIDGDISYSSIHRSIAGVQPKRDWKSRPPKKWLTRHQVWKCDE